MVRKKERRKKGKKGTTREESEGTLSYRNYNE